MCHSLVEQLKCLGLLGDVHLLANRTNLRGKVGDDELKVARPVVVTVEIGERRRREIEARHCQKSWKEDLKVDELHEVRGGKLELIWEQTTRELLLNTLNGRLPKGEAARCTAED